jgi:vitamin B12 transporter
LDKTKITMGGNYTYTRGLISGQMMLRVNRIAGFMSKSLFGSVEQH